MPPRAKLCYICGRPYLLPSYDIHVTQCKEIFEKRESLKPMKERRRVPMDPSLQSSNYLSNNSNTNKSKSNSVSSNNSNNIIEYSNNNTSSKSNKPISSNQMKRSQYEDQQVVAGAYGLNHCPHCNRTFNDVSFPKHVKICLKVFQSKRKPFDSVKARAKDTELMQYNMKSNNKFNKLSNTTSKTLTTASNNIKSKSPLNVTSTSKLPSYTANTSINSNYKSNYNSSFSNTTTLPKWKADSLAFRHAMKEAKKVTQAQEKSKSTGIPLHLLLPNNPSDRSTNTSIPSGYITCPTCNRSFNEQAGSRHIPQCKSIINKPKVLYRGSGVPSYSTNSPEIIKQNQRPLSSNALSKSSNFNSKDNLKYNITSNNNSTGYNIITGGPINTSTNYYSNDRISATRSMSSTSSNATNKLRK